MKALETIEAVQNIREQLFETRKVQLHTGLEGYNSPQAFGIYKNDGGNALGVVGSTYEPVDLHLLFDSIMENATCCEQLELDKMTFRELFDGSKVEFVIPAQKFEVESPMVGDVIESRLVVRTGFDGLTKTSMNFESYRIWCSNGCGSWTKDEHLSLKNTKGNNLNGKTYYLADKMMKVIGKIDDYRKQLNFAVQVPITQNQIDEFLIDLIGKKGEEYAELKTRSRNMIDAINEAISIEMNNTGANAYSVLQGVTRYTSHDVLDGNLDTIAFNKAGRMNKKAHDYLLSLI